MRQTYDVCEKGHSMRQVRVGAHVRHTWASLP